MRTLETIHQLDLRTFDWCLRRKHREFLVACAKVLSRSGDGPLYLILALILTVAVNQSFIVLFLSVFALERGLYFVLKHYFKRNRPPQVVPDFKSIITPSDQFSFPSGHTSGAFAMTVLLVTVSPVLFWVLMPWAVAVGISRVLLGVHFPTDILAGAILGVGSAFLVLNLI